MQLPQDLKFSNEELEKAFPKMTRKQWLQSLRKQYDRKEYDDDGRESRCTKSAAIRFA